MRGDRKDSNASVWAAEQGTLKSSGDAVALDRLLIKGLFNKKEPEVEGDELSLDHTLQRLLKKLQQWSRILCAAPQVCAAPRCDHPHEEAGSVSRPLGSRPQLPPWQDDILTCSSECASP